MSFLSKGINSYRRSCDCLDIRLQFTTCLRVPFIINLMWIFSLDLNTFTHIHSHTHTHARAHTCTINSVWHCFECVFKLCLQPGCWASLVSASELCSVHLCGPGPLSSPLQRLPSRPPLCAAAVGGRFALSCTQAGPPEPAVARLHGRLCNPPTASPCWWGSKGRASPQVPWACLVPRQAAD